MVRYLEDHSRGLSSQRLAKLVLQFLHESGIDTRSFKAHSLRGASASCAASSGTPAPLVRQRGGWSSDSVFDLHYARAHQNICWDDLFLGVPEVESSTSWQTPPRVSAPSSKISVPFSSRPGEELRGEIERLVAETLERCNASGFVVDLTGGPPVCTQCSSSIMWEGSSCCSIAEIE